MIKYEYFRDTRLNYIYIIYSIYIQNNVKGVIILAKATNNHLKRKDPKKLYKFDKNEVIYEPDIKEELAPGFGFTIGELIEKYDNLKDHVKELETIIKAATDEISHKCALEGVCVESGINLQETLKNSLQALLSMNVINSDKKYKHLKTDSNGIVKEVSTISTNDGILDIDSTLPGDLIKGYYKVVDGRLIVDKELKQRYLKTLTKGEI